MQTLDENLEPLRKSKIAGLLDWCLRATFARCTQKKEQGHQTWISIKKRVEDDLERSEHESKFECDDLI